MVNHDRLAIAAHRFCEGHDAIGRGDDLGAIAASDIDSAMERSFTIEWIDALAETSGHLAFNRPKIWSRIRTNPVRRGRIAGQTHRQTDHGCSRQGRGT